MHWTWHSCVASVRNVLSCAKNLTGGNFRAVASGRLCPVRNVCLLFHHISLQCLFSAKVYSLRGGSFSLRCWLTLVNTRRSSTRSRGYRCPLLFNSTSGLGVAKPAHRIRIGVFFIVKRHVVQFILCAVCYLMCCRRYYDHTNLFTPACVSSAK
jgi:hypothetical protein